MEIPHHVVPDSLGVKLYNIAGIEAEISINSETIRVVVL